MRVDRYGWGVVVSQVIRCPVGGVMKELHIPQHRLDWATVALLQGMSRE